MKPAVRSVVLSLATAATALGLATPPAQAYGGEDSWSDGGSSYGDRDGTSSWGGSRDWDRDWDRDWSYRDGGDGMSSWDGDKDHDWHGDRTRTFSWDGKRHHQHAWSGGTDDVSAQAAAFEAKQQGILDALNRTDAYLSGLADRILASDLDPSLKGRLLELIEARRAALAELVEQVQAATTLEELKALRWWSLRS